MLIDSSSYRVMIIGTPIKKCSDQDQENASIVVFLLLIYAR